MDKNTTNIIIAVNDIGALSVDVHVDMKPLQVNFMLDQVNFKNCLLFSFPKFLKPKKSKNTFFFVFAGNILNLS